MNKPDNYDRLMSEILEMATSQLHDWGRLYVAEPELITTPRFSQLRRAVKATADERHRTLLVYCTVNTWPIYEFNITDEQSKAFSYTEWEHDRTGDPDGIWERYRAARTEFLREHFPTINVI